MGWAARARVGRWVRTQQLIRRRQLTYHVLPRLIGHQLKRLGLALLLWPVLAWQHRQQGTWRDTP